MNKKILVIGAGPILVGQACEFDYSGSQSCKTLKEENFNVILLNSNPATIMTDYEIANTVYIEKINKNSLIKIVQIEKPDFILPTMGGQTALNCILDFINSEYNFPENKILGINKKILMNAESRLIFYKLINNLNLKCPDSVIIKISNLEEINNVNFPCIIRPSFTLGGLGSGIAYNNKSLNLILKNAFLFSNEVSLDKSIIGWKEFELELLIDNYNNIIVICCIENIDPVGIHTGDSITITPAQTISDKEYQNMRDSSFIILKSIGLKGGGANIQFAINPINGDLIVIEMNPRISRSAALSSKATGYPIAKISTKLSIGYSLLKIFNNSKYGKFISGYEPCIDYIAIKIPKFNFEKYLELNFLNTVMKSIGEVLGIGFSFQEAFLKAIYSVFENNKIPSFLKNKFYNLYKNKAIKKIINSNSTKIFNIIDLFRLNVNIKFIFCVSKIDPWFLFNIKKIIEEEKFFFNKIKNNNLNYKKIDLCSNEFEKPSLYYYSSKNLYFNELRYSIKKKIIIIGSGTNRIGQSIEFDYCCAKFSKLIKKIGLISTMINCNPETVSTDYDTSNYLFFEPITIFFINNIISFIKPILIICQIGGQSPINYLIKNNKINKIFFGFDKNNIFFGKKKKFNKVLYILKLNRIKNYNCININDLILYFNIFNKTIITRLPNIIGGALMKILCNNKEFLDFINFNNIVNIYIENFLLDFKELDLDVLVENGKIIVLSIVEHIESTGIHSGDSSMIFPSYSLSSKIIKKIFFIINIFCYKLKLNGIINFQICFKKKIYIIECNPRASRTVPFISKSNKYTLIYNYVLILLGYNICFIKKKSNFYFIKSSIFPLNKFKMFKLSPEMKSTGEEMNSGLSIQECFSKLFLLSDKTVFLNTKNTYIYIKYLKKINFKLKTNSFKKKINLDLHINSYVLKRKNNMYIISDKLNILSNDMFSNKNTIIFFLSSFDKKFLLVRKLNKI
ncbi:carbamoylphosphate synthase large subunit [Candidatus Carsonella ruddii PV]|uniref:Carbamoylphosphate synthase large subunit n=1 Tax=Carsonella ruddii (strain PV) TaxID=387662 RepID=Q05FS3_CARRP|nr:carbamoyl phosphate synthase large subunit [Candidatus Carsonella ruddii]BAF35098.1 carbamoylphosphate synthase large subunit [Candidatus Carsonella ruddii PV]